MRFLYPSNLTLSLFVPIRSINKLLFNNDFNVHSVKTQSNTGYLCKISARDVDYSVCGTGEKSERR